MPAYPGAFDQGAAPPAQALGAPPLPAQETLSAYELQRLRNIESNQGKLEALGLDRPLAPPRPKRPKRSVTSEEPVAQPTRWSTRDATTPMQHYDDALHGRQLLRPAAASAGGSSSSTTTSGGGGGGSGATASGRSCMALTVRQPFASGGTVVAGRGVGASTGNAGGASDSLGAASSIRSRAEEAAEEAAREAVRASLKNTLNVQNLTHTAAPSKRL